MARFYGTPLYIYSESVLRENILELKAAFEPHSFHIAYALKANSNPALLAILREQGLGLDIVSGGELQLALACDFPASAINFAGVGKTADEIILALTTGIQQFDVESEFELDLLEQLASQTGAAPVLALLRLNPDIDARTHPHISTGLRYNKFGMSPDLVRELLTHQERYPHLRLLGLHCHIGSQIREGAPYLELVDFLEGFVAELEDAGVEIEVLDLGGGFGVDNRDPFGNLSRSNPYLAEYAAYARGKFPELRLQVQPGRALTANSGILACRVQGIKSGGDTQFVVTDGAMTELLRPALYDSYHAILNGRRTEGKMLADVVGPVCESSDALARGREMDAFEAGDLLIVGSTGAYGSAMGSTYNMRPLAPEVLVRGDGSHSLIRRRQDFQGLTSLYPDLDGR